MVWDEYDAFMKAHNEANGKMSLEDIQRHWLNISTAMTAVLIGLDLARAIAVTCRVPLPRLVRSHSIGGR